MIYLHVALQVSLHHEDKLLLQNYGRRMENDRPGGTWLGGAGCTVCLK